MNPIPDEKQIELMLENIPSEPGARLDRRLSGAPWTPRTAARRRISTSLAMGFLTLALVTALTPQGRAFAQEILQFFTRLGSDVRPVPTLALSVSPEASSAGPEAANPFANARLPFEETCGDFYHARCGLDEIRALVSFPVKGPAETAADMTFAGATGGPEQVILFYQGENVNGSIILFEEPVENGYARSLPVAASAEVEPVSINGAAGEYVQGGWLSMDANNEEGVSWWDDPFVQTLRWETDGVLYTMTFHAGKDTGIKLEKPDLLFMAEQMTTEVNAVVIPAAPPMAIPDISQQAGFQVVEPGWVPDGYTFLKASYTPGENTACLYYRYGEGSLPVLAIAERPAKANILDDISISSVDFDGKQITIPVVTELLSVGGAPDGQATLVLNGVHEAKLCPERDLPTNQALFWQHDGKDYVIFGLIDQYEGGVFISRLEMQRLAENLTGTSTLSEIELDPQRLHTIDDAQSLASFEVKAPAQIVPGMHFDHAAYLPGEKTETVRLVYTPEGSPTRGGIDYGLFISQAKGEKRTMEEVTLWGGSEDVTINSQDARYRKFCWDNTATGTLECYQELYWDENDIGYDLKVYLPGALEKEDFFAIAESVK